MCLFVNLKYPTLFSKKDFIELVNFQNENPLISIFTPTHRAGEATYNGKDALKLKNIVLEAGVDYLIPIYKSTSTYNFLMEDRHVSGNIQNDGLSLIHEKAWNQMSEIFHNERKKHIEKYNEIAHTEVGTNDTKEVVTAAFNGRIDTLFLAKNSSYWGQFDAENQNIVNQNTSTHSNDLLNDAAVQCVMNGGSVYLLDKEEMPCKDSACAILRY